jgi:antitoxin component YwqK of YwqJK toxin-antitoxin module
LRILKIVILFCFCFISCDEKSIAIKQDITVDKIQIPSIEKNKTDVNFKLKNGVLFFIDAPYSGTVNTFYDNGNLKSKSTYYQGKREGNYFGFYPNKKKWFERYYTKGLKIKTHKSWFQNGQQMFEYQFNNQGSYNGFTKDWHLNGQLAKHFNFVEGKETGSQKMWKPTGKIRANFFTVNGERHGLIGLKNCESVIATENN